MTREQEITEMCRQAGCPHRASAWIDSSMSVGALRALLFGRARETSPPAGAAANHGWDRIVRDVGAHRFAGRESAAR